MITHSPQTKKDRNLWFILLSKTKEVHESSIILIKIGPKIPEKIPQIGKNGGNSSVVCAEWVNLGVPTVPKQKIINISFVLLNRKNVR